MKRGKKKSFSKRKSHVPTENYYFLPLILPFMPNRAFLAVMKNS